MRNYTLSVDVDGSGDGTKRQGVPFGILRSVQIKYDGQPAGCDVVLSCVLDGVTKTILTRINTNTDFPIQSVFEPGKDNVGDDVGAGKNAELVLPIVTSMLRVVVDEGSEKIAGVKVSCVIDSF